MTNKILDMLNESQIKAVEHMEGPLLILAGAGSGKTKTITSRLAYLISLGIDPASILTLTFTNKAAYEMRKRAFALIDNMTYVPLLCTFHKFGLLFLKFNIHKLNRKNNFSIIDTDDKRKILKTIDKTTLTSLLASEISKYKNSLIMPNDAKTTAQNEMYMQIANSYEKYNNYLLKNNFVDFDDLILLTYQLLINDEQLAKETSNRYKYIMVDEYQDTNELQFKLLEQLCSNHNNICVVGDDDQSIYGWRGATIKNILNFDSSFKNVFTVKLEKNYRSTNTILKHANLLIEHNRNRLGKTLIGTRGIGNKIKLYESDNEHIENRKIIDDINQLINNDIKLSDIAILYRVNALSRSIEDGLVKAGLNYKLVGGIRFYERSEIKDLIAYFRVIVNPHDNFSLKRIINKPKRGIGKTTIEKLEHQSIKRSVSIFNYLNQVSSEELVKVVGKKISRTLGVFSATIKDLQELLKTRKMKFLDEFEESFDYKQSFKNAVDGEDRLANIDEFHGYLRDFFISNPSSSLDDFLNEISLASEKENNSSDGHISLMSIHASKGLEYKHIFIIGLEEGFFPLNGEDNDIEEERRLGYVAFTRAMDELTLSFSHNRLYKGRRTPLMKSRFLNEAGLIQGSLKIQKSSLYKKGDVVKHKMFGMGRIESVSKTTLDLKLKINFSGIVREILSGFVEKI